MTTGKSEFSYQGKLTPWKIIRGSSAVPIHLAGLARLVKLRGGLAFLPDPPYALVPGLITYACLSRSRLDADVYVQM
jgi:hypothetical protein